MDAGALVALEAQLAQSERERERLASELRSARALIQDLEHKVTAAEQSSDLFARQLEKVKESYQTKLLLRDEQVAVERAAVLKEKESELAHQQALFAHETELWQQQIAALTKAQRERQDEHDHALRSLRETHSCERDSLHARCRALEAAQQHDRDEIEYLSDWKQQREYALADVDAHRAELEQENADWRRRCEEVTQRVQTLEQQVDGLLLEREDRFANIERARERFARDHADANARMRETAGEVAQLRTALQQLARSARDVVRSEVEMTQRMLRGMQERAYELVLRQQQRETAVATKQSKIIQLEAQLKNDKQTRNDLEAALALATRTLERKTVRFKSKYQEQKEHLEITLAVRQGLAGELQTKKQQVLDLEKALAHAALSKSRGDTKIKQLQQQVQILQHTRVRELEKYALVALTAAAKKQAKETTFKTKSLGKSANSGLASRGASALLSGPAVVLESNNECGLLPSDVSADEWREFADLVAAHGEELALQRRRE